MAAAGGASGPGVEPGRAPPLPALGGASAAAPCPALRGRPREPAGHTGSQIPGCGVLTGSFEGGEGRVLFETRTSRCVCLSSDPTSATSQQSGQVAQTASVSLF